MFEKRVVTIELTEPMLGTVCKDPKVYKTFIESKKPEDIQEDESANVEKIEEKGWTGFMKDDDGIFIYDYMVKGFLKNAGNVLKLHVKVKNLRSKIGDAVFIGPRKLRFIDKTEPDDILERPLRAMTKQGPRVAVVRSDVVNPGAQITFELKFLKHSQITDKLLKSVFEYGLVLGLGQWRGGGYGTFKVISYEVVK